MLKPGPATANERIKAKSSVDTTATFPLNPVCTESRNLASIKVLISKQRDAIQQVHVPYTVLCKNQDGRTRKMPAQKCVHTDHSYFSSKFQTCLYKDKEHKTVFQNYLGT